jgi:hypothetical protein
MPVGRSCTEMRIFTSEILEAWRIYINALEKGLDSLDQQIKEAYEMTSICTDEWCNATEHVIDDLSNSLFSIIEPRWLNEEDSRRIKAMKRRLHDLYANYREVYQKVG